MTLGTPATGDGNDSRAGTLATGPLPANWDRMAYLRDATPPLVKRAAQSVSVTAGRVTSRARMVPAFLIVGGQRCGTSSMSRALSQHPAVFKAVLHKEVHYFDTGYGHGPGWYRGHFPLRARARLTARAAGAVRWRSSPAPTTCSTRW